MIQFSKLRLNGFKSFVDRTELEIGPGMNGIVGPNGCGKSNLVEALRWVMGESSAKRMRGGGMEDVIFSGSEKRSARNIAEVSLLLDNSTRQAPAAYNNLEEIEVTRRIERDHGSNYKINGKNVRARDVQLLFADTVTGSNSPALVSQGRVAQIINAKPLDRKMILEESAGIAGLYARRHEAELRLKAADRNLLRVEDILGGMEGRLNSLKRQAREAGRYRNLATQIKQLELIIAYLEWAKLEERAQANKEKFSNAESIVAEKMTSVTQLTKTQTAQAKDIQPLRQAEAEIATVLQTQKLALQRLEDDEERREELLEETKSQLSQTKYDHNHEETSLSESKATLKTVEEELKSLAEQEKKQDETLKEKEALKDKCESETNTLEEQYTALMQDDAQTKARKQSLEQQIVQNKERLEVIEARKEKAETELKELSEKNEGGQKIEVLQKEIKTLSFEQEKINKNKVELKNSKVKLEAKQQEQREILKAAEKALSEIETEIAMLKTFLENDENGEFTPILESVTPEVGFEKAISRALGESLMASLDDDAPMRWQASNVNGLPPLPAGCKALGTYIKAPEILEPALSQIGVVEDQGQGQEVALSLKPGQSLVSTAGTYWRWDGLFIKAEAHDRNAQYLEQKNKLKQLHDRKPSLETDTTDKKAALDATSEELVGVLEQQEETGQTYDTNDAALNEKRATLSKLKEEHARFDAKAQHLKSSLATAKEDLETLKDVIKWDEQRLTALNEEATDDKSANVQELKVKLDESREAYRGALRDYDLFMQEQRTRKARLQALADERISMQNRSIRSGERIKELAEREKTLTAKLRELSNAPEDSKRKKDELLDKISKLEHSRAQAADKLAQLESELGETNRALKAAEQRLSSAKEERAAAQATLGGIQEQQDVMKAQIAENFELSPEELKTHIAADVEKNEDDLDALRRKKDQLYRERDQIGPVNLRAENEANELEKEVGGLLNERNDLIKAIEELRGGIQTINTEARERLLLAFEHVNAHFQRLFSRLFAGGKAHLELIDSDDALSAGLEIYAQPPGKALQSLSLLSGGEQALTSIALIFAMFLTNPSPICVLDEIDAPLDDANVDRLCQMLEEISARGETRFIIVTHHRMTMARMDRLYGVTMAEKGISQLVSVDLQQSFEFLEEAA
ncbi:MAG: chromosome segregation protein SMC [Pseudomonadota bacterium]